MWSRAEGCECPLDLRQHGEHFGGPWLPREVEGDAVLVVERTEPEVVGRDRADLRHAQERGEHIAQLPQLRQGRCTVVARHEVLRLQFVATAGREAEPEVRQTIEGRARNTQLLRGVFCTR